MKAEDTVMNIKQVREVYNGTELKPVLQAQAGISFKAGYGQSILDNDNWARETYGYKAAREELKKQIESVKANAFSVSLFGNLEHQLKMDAMVNAYEVCLNKIKGMGDEHKSNKKKVA